MSFFRRVFKLALCFILILFFTSKSFAVEFDIVDDLRVESESWLEGNVGIGTTTTSAAELTVDGKVLTTELQVGTSTTSGYVLTADSSGNATWQAAAGGGSGDVVAGSSETQNYLTKWETGSGTQDITDSVIYDDGTNIGIGTTNTANARLTVNGETYTTAFQLYSASDVSNYVLTADTDGDASWVSLGTLGGGDVNGPASSTDNAIVRWDSTTGDTIQDSSVVIDDNGNVGIGTATPVESLHVQDAVYIAGETVEKSGYNRTVTFIKSTSGNVLIYQPYYWDGDSFEASKSFGVGYSCLSNNSGIHANAFGHEALYSNSGAYACGFGSTALYSNTGYAASGFGHAALMSNQGDFANGFGDAALNTNTGSGANGFGAQALFNNTGDNASGFGHYALYNNAGDSASGVGLYALYHNIGSNVEGMGTSVLALNAGNNVQAMGASAMGHNTGAASIGLGAYALRYNQMNNNIAIGYNSWSDFYDNSSGADTFAYSAVDVGNDRITITGHGYTGRVNLRYDQGSGDAIGGLVDGDIYQFTVIDANTLELRGSADISSTGSGTDYTLTPQYTYENTIVIGAEADPSASNQVVLGNNSITQTLLKGNVGIGTTDTSTVALHIEGNVAIGTTTMPEAGLVVDGDICISGGSCLGDFGSGTLTGLMENGNAVTVTNYGGPVPTVNLGGAMTGDVDISSSTASDVLFLDDSSSNVGIGSTVPAAKLDVTGGALFSGNVGIGTSSALEALHVDDAIYVTGRTIINSGENYTNVYLKDSSANFLVFQPQFWDGDSFESTSNYGFGHAALESNNGMNVNAFGNSALANNTGDYANGFGFNALGSNSGYASCGFGFSALVSNSGDASSGFGNDTLGYNTGNNANGFGAYALYNNSGTAAVGFGSESLYNNSGNYAVGIGYYALRGNSGSNAIGVGYGAMITNAGSNSIALGNDALSLNAGNSSLGFGNNALRYNNNNSNIAIGYDSWADFHDDTGSADTFSNANVDADNDTITISSHGYTGYVNLRYDQGSGSAIGGLIDNSVYQFEVTDANTLTIRATDITSVGSGSDYTLTPQYSYQNTIVIGSEIEPTGSNQVILGNSSVTQTILQGNVGVGTTDTGAAELTVDGDISVSGTVDGVDVSSLAQKHIRLNLISPYDVYSATTAVCLVPSMPASTVTNIEITTNTSSYDVAGDIMLADDFISKSNSEVVNSFDTASGVLSDSSISNAGVDAGQVLYISFDSQPDGNITQLCIDITYEET